MTIELESEEEREVSVEFRNNGDCDDELRARIVSDLFDEPQELGRRASRIDAKTSTAVTDTIEVPRLDVGEEDFELEFQVYRESLSGPEVLDRNTVDVTVVSSIGTINSVDFDSSVCIGKDFDVDVTVSSEGQESLYFVELVSDELDLQDGEELEMEGGDTEHVSLTSAMPVLDDPNQEFDFTITLESYLDRRNLLMQDEQEEVVTPLASDIEISDTESPASVCGGTSHYIDIEVDNTGVCDSVVDVQLKERNIEYEESIVEDIESENSRVFEFEVDVPIGLDLDDLNFDVDVIQQVGSVGITEDADTLDIEYDTAQLEIDSIESSSTVCIGEEFEIEVEATNEGLCPADARVSVDNEYVRGDSSRSETVGVGETIEYSNSFTIPEDLDSDITRLSFEVATEQLSDSWEQSDVQDVIVQVVRPDIVVNSVDAPSSVCVLQSFPISADFRNDTPCEAEVRARLSGDNLGVSETSTRTLDGDSEDTFTDDFMFDFDAPNITSSERVEAEVEYLLDGEWVKTDTQSVSIVPNEADAEITFENSVTARPGAYNLDAQLTNTTSCPLEVEASLLDDSFTQYVSEDGNVSGQFELDVGTSPVDVTSELRHTDTSTLLDEEDLELTPFRFGEVDNESGVIRLVGGFDDDIAVFGQAGGRGLTTGLSVDQSLTTAGGSAAIVFQGELSRSPFIVAEIEFDELDYLNIRADADITWVVDGEVQGDSNTFRFSTPAGERIQEDLDEIIDPEEVSLEYTQSTLSWARSKFAFWR